MAVLKILTGVGAGVLVATAAPLAGVAIAAGAAGAAIAGSKKS
ncbi:hypothetical protein [Helicobacter vulpis]|nr:hypothetical protein [Helicobacter vulpis]